MNNSLLKGRKPPAGAVVFCDFDGTITQEDVTDQILTQLAHPSWREVEQEWMCGAIGSRECLERQMALVETSAADLHALIDAIPLDPHFAAFYRFTQKRRMDFYVVSDGFDYVIRRVLKRSGVNGPLRNGTHLFASALRVEGRRLVPSFPHSEEPCEHGCATCKAAVMRRFRDGHRPVVFVGDGLSDRYALEEADLIFAKRQLLAYCREHGIACHPFETFAEVQAILDKFLEADTLKSKVESRKSKARSRRAPVPAFDF